MNKERSRITETLAEKQQITNRNIGEYEVNEIEIYKEISILYQLGITSGMIKHDELITYCDSLIEHLPQPPSIFIEISLENKKLKNSINQIMNEFHKYDVSDDKYIDLFLGYLSNCIMNEKIDLDDGVNYACNLLVNTGKYEDDKYYKLYTLTDSLYLATSKIYGDEVTIRKEYISIIREYNKYFDMFIIQLNQLESNIQLSEIGFGM